MANAVYPKALEKFLSGSMNLLTDTIKVSGLTSAYTYSSAHEFRSSLAGVTFTSTLANKSVTDGVFDADDLTITGVSPGSTITSLAIWKDTGSNSTSPLIYYADTFSSGIPIFIELTGGQIIISWSDEPTRIFKI